jgi:ATP-dependent DNA ligase
VTAAGLAPACTLGLEGIISKRRGSPYLSGKSPVWRKTMCTLTDHFAVMGADRIGRSLRLSRFLDRGLVPCGSAGSGLGDGDARQIPPHSTRNRRSSSRWSIAASHLPVSYVIPSSEDGIAADHLGNGAQVTIAFSVDLYNRSRPPGSRLKAPR